MSNALRQSVRSEIQNLVDVPVAYNSVPATPPYVWVQQSGSDTDRGIGGCLLGTTTTFDVECVAITTEAAVDLSDLIKQLDGERGNFGSTWINKLVVSDVADDYVARSTNDIGLKIVALQLTIFT